MKISPDIFYRPDADELRSIAAKQTFAKWRCTGQGPTYHLSGSRILYKGADILAWLEKNRVATSPPQVA